MEVMDYEKKYKNALEHAKECLKDGGISQNSIDYIESIFPELKESEDEKIRKELIEQVVYIAPNDDEVDSEGNVLPTYQKRIDKYRTWLEKQGEQKVIIPQFRVGETIKYKECIYPYQTIEEIGNYGYKLRDCYTNTSSTVPFDKENEFELVEQKPAWSEEDERQCNNIISLVEGKAIMRKDIKGFVNWLKSLKNNFLKLNKWNEEDEALIEPIIEFLETGDIYNTTISSMTLWLKSLKGRVQPQPKQEWSEEDAKMMKNIIDDIHCGTIFNPKVMHAASEREKWFKSICMRYQGEWKPSALQTEALESATENCAYSEYQDCLRELIEQLKKLREE